MDWWVGGCIDTMFQSGENCLFVFFCFVLFFLGGGFRGYHRYVSLYI